MEGWLFLALYSAFVLFLGAHGVVMFFYPREATILTEWWERRSGFHKSDKGRQRETRIAGIVGTAIALFMLILPLRRMFDGARIAGDFAPHGVFQIWGMFFLGSCMFGSGMYMIRSASRKTVELLNQIPEITLVSQEALKILIWRARVFGLLLIFGSLLPFLIWAKHL